MLHIHLTLCVLINGGRGAGWCFKGLKFLKSCPKERKDEHKETMNADESTVAS